MQLAFSSVTSHLPALMMGENLIIASCYAIIGSGIAYGIWRHRQAGVSPVVVTVAAIFYSCSFGHGMHSLGMLGLPNALVLQTGADLITVAVALRFLSYYESFDVLARISQIAASKAQLESQNELLQATVEELQQTQTQLVQAEKMSSLGQLVAGVAHEINNPVNFIAGNLKHVEEYAHNLLSLVNLYQQSYPQSNPQIEAETDEMDLLFLQEDLPKLLSSMKLGTDRIRQIVLSLRNFSRMDEAAYKVVDIHDGIDSTLLILQHRLQEQPGRPTIELIKDYGSLPLVECYAGQLNQVFMNILANAIDALEQASAQKSSAEPDQICIQTRMIEAGWVQIAIADSGPGMPQSVRDQIFNPFFTTKPVGKGTGIGMSISYQIVVEKHQGKLECHSQLGQGTEFRIQIPIQQPKDAPTVYQLLENGEPMPAVSSV